MRLLEYDAKKFLTNNKYEKSKRKKCVQNGFTLGMFKFFKSDWLGSNDKYTYIDFVNEVYELNYKTQEMDENDLIESLARFLCGYDEAIKLGESIKIQNQDEHQQHITFQNYIYNVDDNVTNEKIEEKIKIIKGILNI